MSVKVCAQKKLETKTNIYLQKNVKRKLEEKKKVQWFALHIDETRKHYL